MKKRLDQILVERQLVASRERAQGLILAAKVLVNDVPCTKPGQKYLDQDIQIRIRGEDHPYVSRGGIKLEAALKAFRISPPDKVALDIGASTGGFTHVLLLGGIRKVYAIDVGHNQMDWKIRQDSRVVVKEKLNARYLNFSDIGEKVDIIVVDVSFISLTKILPALKQFAKSDTDWITLIKPQFEAGREKIGKNGILNSEEERQYVVEQITDFCHSIGLTRSGLIESPIAGTQGNKEFLAHWTLKEKV